jgi:hypothetical protein
MAQLATLGISPTAEEEELHDAIGTRRAGSDSRDIERARIWLEKIHAANRHLAVFPEPAFSSVLKRRWAEVCGKGNQGICQAWKRFHQPGFSRAGRLGPGEYLKFAAKCALHGTAFQRSSDARIPPTEGS